MTSPPDFAALFAASPYPYLLVDRAFIIIGANPAYLQSTGRTADEIVGLHIFEAFPANPADPESTNLDEVRISIEQAIATRKPHTSALLRYAVPRETPEGTVFDERFWSAIHTPVFDAAGEVAFVSQNAIDVTDLYRFDVATRKYYLKQDANAVPDIPLMNRPQMHEAMTRILSAERDQLQMLFNQAPGAMAVLTGADHVVEMVNAACYQLVGQRDILGQPLLAALPELVSQGFRELLDDAFASGQPVVLRETRMALRRGPGEALEDRYVDLLFQPMVDADRRVTGIFAQGNDVTAAFEANRALRAADQRKDEFLAMLAHELRNPLAPIGAAADLLQIGKLDEARVRQTSQIIARQVRHMTSLVDDLLDVSRVTGGLAALDMERLDIRQIVDDAVEQVAPLIHARRHQLVRAVPDVAPLVMGDRKRLVQVLANLINNAAKYTAEGGQLAVDTEVTPTEVLLHVEDNGIGMVPDLVEHAFDLFSQAERSSDRSLGGLGLGLALVKSLVGLHHGSVRCASPGLGQGSTFTVCLPRLAAAPAAEPAAPTAVPTRLPGGAMRIMVVDDNGDAASMLALLLQSIGHEVMVEHDAVAALARCQSHPPDVFLLDIGLPEIDGNALARRLRARPASAGALLVAVTGYGQDEDRARTTAAGFDHHLVKPVDMKLLYAILAEVQPARH